MGGTVGTQYQNIPEYFGNVPTRDLGRVSSEGRHTIPVIDQSSESLLAINGHYYEFLPENEPVTNHPHVLEGHELEIGKSYRLIITTSSGLFHYNLDDIVCCTGFAGETPVLEFLQKGDRHSDLEGEKVTEFQVVCTVAEASRQLGLTVHQFTAVPHRPESTAPCYVLMFEAHDVTGPQRERFLRCFDQNLRDSNMMYNHQRSDEFLAHAEMICIPSRCAMSSDLKKPVAAADQTEKPGWPRLYKLDFFAGSWSDRCVNRQYTAISIQANRSFCSPTGRTRRAAARKSTRACHSISDDFSSRSTQRLLSISMLIYVKLFPIRTHSWSKRLSANSGNCSNGREPILLISHLDVAPVEAKQERLISRLPVW